MSQTVMPDDVESWPLMSSPLEPAIILTLYLSFVLQFGPSYMAKRNPFNLKTVMLIYNAFQVCFSAFFVILLVSDPDILAYAVRNQCSELHPSNEYLSSYVKRGLWWYVVSKVIDLADTVFFVLRKKQNQVTFLHVWHHSNMLITAWIYVKYVQGIYGAFPGTLNAAVHIIMYGYYLLSTLGPSIRKYLTWKKYITRLQMGQFVLIGLYLTILAVFCDLPSGFILFLFAEVVSFLILFLNFYKKSY